jgi:hypothetical protein
VVQGSHCSHLFLLTTIWFVNIFYTQTVYRHHPHTDKTSIHVHIVNNLRGRPIFAGDAPLTTPYIHNAVFRIPVPPIPVSAFQTESLGALTLRMRRAILAYNADPVGVRADLRWLFQGANQFKTLFPCPPGAEFSVACSWRMARFMELDISGACVGGKTRFLCPRSSRRGRVCRCEGQATC